MAIVKGMELMAKWIEAMFEIQDKKLEIMIR